MNPHLESGYDSSLLTHHCGFCETPLYTHDEVLEDHLLCAWSHYGYVKYPHVLATDSKGKTIEGKIAKPARTVLTRIPHQSAISYCLDCAPPFGTVGCGLCGKDVDKTKPYSRLEAIERYVNGLNKNFQVYYLHHECLPKLFTEVRKYHRKYSQ